MAPELHMSFLGAVLAFVFTAFMANLLWWMFHVPRAIPLAAAKARRAVGAVKKILVPTSGTAYSERGIELACRLGEEQKAEIYLVTVLEVPRTLPLEAPMPEAEAKADEIIKEGGIHCHPERASGKGRSKTRSDGRGGDYQGGKRLGGRSDRHGNPDRDSDGSGDFRSHLRPDTSSGSL